MNVFYYYKLFNITQKHKNTKTQKHKNTKTQNIKLYNNLINAFRYKEYLKHYV